MSATSNPFGARPSYSSSGIIRPEAFTIASAYNANIFQFQPIKIGTNGTLEAAAVADRIIGVFMGVEYTDSEGRRRYSNRWLANTIATDVVAYSMRDQQPIVYEIQTNAAIIVDDIGKQFQITAASGNTVTGLSTQMINVASSAANAPFRLLNIAPGADNAWGDTFVIGRFQISQHQEVADLAAY
jgi:hypothetical protein